MSNFSKMKGSQGEQEVAEILTKFFGHKFERAPFSGAFLGGQNANRDVSDTLIQVLSGDLIPPESLKYLYTEVKRGEDNYININKNKMVWVESWLKQVSDGLKLTGSKPFIWLRRNREPWFIILSKNLFLDIVGTEEIKEFTYINYYSEEYGEYIITLANNIFCEKYKNILEKLFGEQ